MRRRRLTQRARFGTAYASARVDMESAKDALERARASVRPWQSWADRNAYERPENAGEALARAKKNAGVFKANYALVVVGCAAVTLATSPRALLTLAVVATVAVRVLSMQVSIAGKTLTPAERAVLVCAAAFVSLFILTDAGAVLLTGACVGLVAVAAHAAAYTYEELFTQ